MTADSARPASEDSGRPERRSVPRYPCAVRIEQVQTAHSGALATLCHHQRIQSLDDDSVRLLPPRREQGENARQHSQDVDTYSGANSEGGQC